MLDLEKMRAFVTFAEHLNFTRAARVLHISQPALHTQIRKLADELNVALYWRKGRTLTLTPDGVRVACFGRELLARVGEFRAELHDVRSDRPVVLIAGEGAYLYLLGPTIESFIERDAAPLRLMTADRHHSLEVLRHGVADLAVVALDMLPTDMDSSVDATLLVSVPQVLVVPKVHPLATLDQVSVHDMEGMRLVVPPPEREHRRVLTTALTRAGVNWDVAVEASGWPLILHFVGLGLGCAVVNGCCAIPKQFVTLPVRELPSQRYYLLQRNSSMPAQVKLLRDLLVTDLTKSSE